MSRIGIRTGNRLEVMGDTPSRQEGETALAELLVLRGTIDRAGLDRAWRAQEGTGRKLPEVLAALGLVAERELAAGLAEVLSLPLARPEDYPRAPVLDGRLSPKFLKAREFLPLSETESGLVAAMVDPADDFAARAVEVKIAKPVERRIAVPSELEEALERLYGSGRTQIEEIVDSLDGEGDAAPDDAERLRDLASEAPVIRLVGLLIAESVERRASDIHIEPFDNRLRVRYRIDGVMQEVASHPSRLRFAIISRIKIMAKLNIAERRLPQDGRIRLSVRGNEVDLRVSTVPTDHGESVVLRVLDKSAVVLDFDRLGFAPDNRDAIRALLARPNGIVLVTGPTGSGKTTTLYTALMELNGPERKILTVEDPIEFQIEGINQIAIRPQIGLGFAEVLRSILRQDPDIIMVGEIRDLETAQIAVQAALTGHTVLSTLHTNSAAASVTRLLEMGIEGYLLISTLSGVVAQRLVRRLCPACSRPHPVSGELVAKLGLDRLPGIAEPVVYEPVGCEGCENTGYSGRLARILVLAVLALAGPGIAAGGAGAQDAAPIQTLRDQVESLARTGAFLLEGSSNIENGQVMLVSGDIAARITRLLADHDFVLIRGDAGRIAKLTVIGPSRPPDKALSGAVRTSRHGAEHYVEATLVGRGGVPKTAALMLDTGASTIVLPVSMMADLGFGERNTEEVTLQTAGGLTKGRLGVLEMVRVGNAEAGSVAVSFLPDERLGGKRLLGMSFLARFVVVIDDAANLVRLEPRGG